MGKLRKALQNIDAIAATPGADNARQLVAMGLTFVPLGAYTGFIRRGAAAELANALDWTSS